MRRLAVMVLMAGGLALVPSVAVPEDRLDRAVREAYELQKRQDQPADPETWLRSRDGQQWLKSYQSRDGKDMSTEPITPVGPVWSPQDVAPASYAVTYLVEGSVSSADVTYKNAQGGSQQETVQVPWRKSFQVPRGAFLYISAQGKYGSEVTVRILADDRELKRSTSRGLYSIATASDSCCEASKTAP